jgi:hypothetical protein
VVSSSGCARARGATPQSSIIIAGRVYSAIRAAYYFTTFSSIDIVEGFKPLAKTTLIRCLTSK